MVAALHGRRASHKADAKRDLLLAWHTGAFAVAAFAGKLKPFKEYLADAETGDNRRLQHAQAIAFFHRLKAKGLPVEITRTVN
jgi:hypothetical protein